MELKDKIKKIFTKPLKKEIPFNGGNLYNASIKIEQKEERIKNWLKQENVNIHNSVNGLANNALFCYNLWYLVNFTCDYFINNFKWKAPNQEINYLLNVIFRTYFLYGNVGVYHKEGKFIPIVVSTLKSNEFNEPLIIEGTIAYDMLNNEIINSREYLNNNKNKIIKIKDLENFTLLRVGSFGLSGMIKWLPFIRQQEDILKKIYNASILINKKLVYKCNDESVAIEELKALYSTNAPFIINKDTISPTSNLFDFGDVIDSDTQFMFDYYNNFLKVYYAILGRRINIDTKKERNISIEVQASQDNLAILEKEEHNLKYWFLEELNRKYNLGIECEQWEEEQENAIEPTNGEQPQPNNIQGTK